MTVPILEVVTEEITSIAVILVEDSKNVALQVSIPPFISNTFNLFQ